jgi:hypothetical protein
VQQAPGPSDFRCTIQQSQALGAFPMRPQASCKLKLNCSGYQTDGLFEKTENYRSLVSSHCNQGRHHALTDTTNSNIGLKLWQLRQPRQLWLHWQLWKLRRLKQLRHIFLLDQEAVAIYSVLPLYPVCWLAAGTTYSVLRQLQCSETAM